jgi:hypothetical protein
MTVGLRRDAIELFAEAGAYKALGRDKTEGAVDSGIAAKRTLFLHFWYPRRLKSILWYCTRH